MKTKIPSEELEALVLEAQRMANLPAECCGRCRFGRHDSGGPFYCFRYPPQVIVLRPAKFREEMRGQFPLTRPDLWCGEFKPRSRRSLFAWVSRWIARARVRAGEISVNESRRAHGEPPIKETLQ